MNLKQGQAGAAREIASVLRKAGHTAVFAGGCVRDFLMGEDPHDIDIATSARPEEIEKLFRRTIPVGRQFGVMIVLQGDLQFEVATFRTEGGYVDGRHPTQVDFTGPEEDSARRDFTVNGLFYDPFDRKVLDYVGGEEDIRRRVIRAIGEPRKRFNEDKLRLLRAVRFASTLDFEIEDATWQAVTEKAGEIVCVSPERIREELVKVLTRAGAARGVRLLSDSGMLKILLPEIEAMRGVEQPAQYHPEGDVFVHTLGLLERLEKPSATLAFSALLHDVAKPRTSAVRNDRICFYGHAPAGARMAREIMKRLKFSNDEMNRVAEAIENHLKFGDVQKMREGKLKRFMARETFEEELELHRIDCLASHGILDHYEFLKRKQTEYANQELKPSALLTGHDLKALGMDSGPAMKPVLDEAYTLQLEGKITSREKALEWARKQLGAQGKFS